MNDCICGHPPDRHGTLIKVEGMPELHPSLRTSFVFCVTCWFEAEAGKGGTLPQHDYEPMPV